MLRIFCSQPTITSLEPSCPTPEGNLSKSLSELIQRGRCAGIEFSLQTELHSSDEGSYSRKYKRGTWAADIGTDALGGAAFTDEDWLTWGASWRAQVMPWAAWAAEHRVSILSPGAELTEPQRHASYWSTLADETREEVRKHGDAGLRLSYGADKGSVPEVTWLDKLDFVGTDPYYALAEYTDEPTTEELQHSWAEKTESLWQTAKKAGRPVLIHEIGWRALKGTNKAPGDWQPTGEQDDGLQDRLYQTMFTEFCVRDESEFGGLFIQGFENQKYSKTGYELQDKPALETIAKAWGGSTTWDECKPEIKRRFADCAAAPAPDSPVQS